MDRYVQYLSTAFAPADHLNSRLSSPTHKAQRALAIRTSIASLLLITIKPVNQARVRKTRVVAPTRQMSVTLGISTRFALRRLVGPMAPAVLTSRGHPGARFRNMAHTTTRLIRQAGKLLHFSAQSDLDKKHEDGAILVAVMIRPTRVLSLLLLVGSPFGNGQRTEKVLDHPANNHHVRPLLRLLRSLRLLLVFVLSVPRDRPVWISLPRPPLLRQIGRPKRYLWMLRLQMVVEALSLIRLSTASHLFTRTRHSAPLLLVHHMRTRSRETISLYRV